MSRGKARRRRIARAWKKGRPNPDFFLAGFTDRPWEAFCSPARTFAVVEGQGAADPHYGVCDKPLNLETFHQALLDAEKLSPSIPIGRWHYSDAFADAHGLPRTGGDVIEVRP